MYMDLYVCIYIYMHTDTCHHTCKALGGDTECFLITEAFSWQGRESHLDRFSASIS